MRICSRCLIFKEESEFNLKRKTKLQPFCKKCQSIYHKDYYEKNKSSYFQKNKKRRKNMKLWLDEQKNSPCVDCGGTFPPCAMDFDHTEDNKLFNVSSLFASVSLETVKREIAKCELICANCHRIRTYNRIHSRVV